MKPIRYAGYSATTNWYASQWYPIVGSDGPGGQKLYVDGTLEAENASYTTSWTGGDRRCIGFSTNNPTWGEQYVDGKLAELGFYASEWTP